MGYWRGVWCDIYEDDKDYFIKCPKSYQKLNYIEFILKKALTMVDYKEDSTSLAKPIENIIKSVIEELKTVKS